MNWEAFIGLATAFTGVVILITVFVGVRQLRHLQQSTQLEGMMRLIDDVQAPDAHEKHPLAQHLGIRMLAAFGLGPKRYVQIRPRRGSVALALG